MPLLVLNVCRFHWLCLAAVGWQAAVADVGFHYFRSDGGIAGPGVGPLPEQLERQEGLRWRVPLDSGHSTPIVVDGRVFLTTWRPEAQELATVALDAESGTLLWRRPVPFERLEAFHPQTGSPATATAACDGQRIFVFFGSSGLLCYGLDGDLLWRQPMGPFQDEYGAGSSPVLVGDLVVLNQDHDINSFLIALRRDSGAVAWKRARPGAVRSYATPALWERNGQKELLVAGALELEGLDPFTGERRWAVGGLARIVIPSPVPAQELIYMASWSPGGDVGRRIALDPWPAALSRWDKDQDGRLRRSEIDNPDVLDRFTRMDLDRDDHLVRPEWERHAEVFRRAENAILALRITGQGPASVPSVVWKHTRGIPYVATPLVHRGLVWMVKDGGLVTKLDAQSGRVLEEERLPAVGTYYASPVTGDGKVYFASESGTVTVVANERSWRVLSSHAFGERIYATPVITRNRLFIRTAAALYCYQGASEAQ